MAPKNNNKTNQYSGVKAAVKANTAPEEPRITSEQVVKAFRAFGFTPNERNHDDIVFWTTKGQSEGIKLIEELSKRRKEINQKEDDNKKEEEQKKKKQEETTNKQNELKVTLPRLSDDDIRNLHDEYGLPSPDPEWVRNNMSNDPTKIRSILDVQRKATDDVLKKHIKNSVNSMPEIPKGAGMTSMPQMPPVPQNMPQQGTGAPGYGMGGPMDMGGDMMGGARPATPFFVGDNALIKIVSPNNPGSSTLWLVDSKNKTLRPIGSEKVLETAFEDPIEAIKSITTLSADALGPNGPLNGFKPLGQAHGLQSDGTMKNLEFSPAQLQKRYGKPQDPNAEQKALSMLDGVLGQVGGQQTLMGDNLQQ